MVPVQYQFHSSVKMSVLKGTFSQEWCVLSRKTSIAARNKGVITRVLAVCEKFWGQKIDETISLEGDSVALPAGRVQIVTLPTNRNSQIWLEIV